MAQTEEYICRGRLTLDGVQFIIEASSLQEARLKAIRGEWSDYDIGGASGADWELLPSTLALNK